jgi:hypothetical protein
MSDEFIGAAGDLELTIESSPLRFERAWDTVIRIKQLSQIRPLLEAILAPVATSVGDAAPEAPYTKPVELTRLPLGPAQTSTSR